MTSKRDLRRRVDRLDGLNPADLPTAGLCAGFAAIDEENDILAEWVDRDRRIIHIDGEPHVIPDALLGLFLAATE